MPVVWTACIIGVPAGGLPKMSTSIGLSVSPTAAAGVGDVLKGLYAPLVAYWWVAESHSHQMPLAKPPPPNGR
jgi:hypothetical protein